MGLNPNVIQFLNYHKENLNSENFQALFDSWGRYTAEHAAEAWVLEEDQDLLIILNNIGISTDYILSKMAEIPQYMLYFCDMIKLVIPNNITQIHDMGLAGNETVEELYIPKSVTHIGKDGIAGTNIAYLEIPSKFEDQLENILSMREDEIEEDIEITFI